MWKILKNLLIYVVFLSDVNRISCDDNVLLVYVKLLDHEIKIRNDTMSEVPMREKQNFVNSSHVPNQFEDRVLNIIKSSNRS